MYYCAKEAYFKRITQYTTILHNRDGKGVGVVFDDII